jgi:hypothetical protein
MAVARSVVRLTEARTTKSHSDAIDAPLHRTHRKDAAMTPRTLCSISLLAILVGSLLAPLTASAWVPIRVSVKMILDGAGNRATLGLSTDADVWDRVDIANETLAAAGSEFRLELVEIVDLPGQAGFFGAMITENLVDNIFDLATNDPEAWLWRHDAINVYINGATSGQFAGYAKFPGDNQIFILRQTSGQMIFLHELGHNLDLRHTHASDSCSDTVEDDPAWSYPNEISQQNYSKDYAQLTASQQALIDQTYFNVMSYHGDLSTNRLTACQLSRMSDQAWDDRDWIVSRVPIYVRPGTGAIMRVGSFNAPFADIDELLGNPLFANQMSGRTLVLEAGAHTMQLPISAPDVEVVTRGGSAHVGPGRPLWTLPEGEVERAPRRVRDGLRTARDAERTERRTRREARRQARQAQRGESRAERAERPPRRIARADDGVVIGLEEALAEADGELRVVIQREIAERHRQAGRWQAAINGYQAVADTTTQPVLRENALIWIERCQARLAEEQAANASRAAQSQ